MLNVNFGATYESTQPCMPWLCFKCIAAVNILSYLAINYQDIYSLTELCNFYVFFKHDVDKWSRLFLRYFFSDRNCNWRLHLAHMRASSPYWREHMPEHQRLFFDELHGDCITSVSQYLWSMPLVFGNILNNSIINIAEKTSVLT